MSSLRAVRLGFAHSDARPLFADADFHLSPGWTGLVGPNGSGKSTLLRLVTGALAPTEGELVVEPSSAVCVLCEQTVEERSAAVEAFAVAHDGHVGRLRSMFGLDPTQLARWPSLSPGERKRWQIGAALSVQPDVLLLDEPTNHLDAGARRRLIQALERYQGVGVVVSHDRELLDGLTGHTLRIHAGTLRLWPGSHGAARREWERELQERVDAREAHRAERRRRERDAARVRRVHAAAEASRSSRKRMKSPKDSDARGVAAKHRADKAAARLGRSAAVARARAEREIARDDHLRVEREVGADVFVGWERPPMRRLVILDRGVIRAGDRVVLRDVRRWVDRDSRIRIEGDNGAGKTTLLRHLVDACALPRDRVLYLPQELACTERRQLLGRVRELPPAERGRVLQVVAALGVDPGSLLASSDPSPGEARKLALALGLGGGAWLLALDEPDNHLDLPSVERLEAALAAYPGALVLVSHDRRFAEGLVTERWVLREGQVRGEWI